MNLQKKIARATGLEIPGFNDDDPDTDEVHGSDLNGSSPNSENVDVPLPDDDRPQTNVVDRQIGIISRLTG